MRPRLNGPNTIIVGVPSRARTGTGSTGGRRVGRPGAGPRRGAPGARS